MNKLYAMKDLEIILGVTNHNIYNWIRHGLPEELKPRKGWNNEVNRETYVFTDKNLTNLLEIKELKSDGFTYEEIKEILSKSITTEPVAVTQDYINNYIELKEKRNWGVILNVIAIILLIFNLVMIYRM